MAHPDAAAPAPVALQLPPPLPPRAGRRRRSLRPESGEGGAGAGCRGGSRFPQFHEAEAAGEWKSKGRGRTRQGRAECGRLQTKPCPALYKPHLETQPPTAPSPGPFPAAAATGRKARDTVLARPGHAEQCHPALPGSQNAESFSQSGACSGDLREASRCSGWSPPACPLPAPCAPRSSGAGETAGTAFIAASGRSLRQGRGASRPWPAFWWWMRQNGGERHLASPVGGRAPLCRSVTQTTHGSGDERPSWMRGAFLPSPASPAGAQLARCRGHLRGTSQQAGAGPLGHRTQSTQEGAQCHPAPCSPGPWALGSTCLPPGGLPAKAWPRWELSTAPERGEPYPPGAQPSAPPHPRLSLALWRATLALCRRLQPT